MGFFFRIVAVASLMSFGCQGSSQPVQQPPVTQAPVTQAPAPPTPAPAQPSAPIQEEPPVAPERRVECRGGEVVATWQRTAGDGVNAQSAKLTFAAAGHRAWTYDFTYEGGVLASARHRISSWSFAGGDVDHPNTHDKLVERRYQLEAGKLAKCTERRAEGDGDAVEQLVQEARDRTIACAQGEPIVALAQHAAQPLANADVAWLDAACESDKSSGLKL